MRVVIPMSARRIPDVAAQIAPQSHIISASQARNLL
jgi:hypothetical protein